MTVSLDKTYKEHLFNTVQELEYWLAHPDQFLLPERFEVVEGKIVETMPTQRPHGRVGVRIISLLDNYVRPRKLGEVLSLEVGYKLEENPLTVRCPDVAFIDKDHQSSSDEEGYIVGAPDLAVEVLSPSNSSTEMRDKTEQYLGHGAQLVWLVDPKRKEVKVYRKGESKPAILTNDDQISGEQVIPGFSCRVSEFFE